VNLNTCSTLNPDLYQVVQADGLINRKQFVKSVIPRCANAQPKVDLRKRTDGHWHGGNDCKVLAEKLRLLLSGRPSIEATDGNSKSERRGNDPR
jgi:hypothetical protein